MKLQLYCVSAFAQTLTFLDFDKQNFQFVFHSNMQHTICFLAQGRCIRDVSEPCKGFWPSCDGQLLELPLGVLGWTHRRRPGCSCFAQVREAKHEQMFWTNRDAKIMTIYLSSISGSFSVTRSYDWLWNPNSLYCEFIAHTTKKTL